MFSTSVTPAPAINGVEDNDLLEQWQSADPEALKVLDKIVMLQSGYVDYLSNKYDVLEKTLNIKMPMRLSDFKAIESAVISKKDYNALDELSIVAEKQYPSMGCNIKWKVDL
jgi:hypothetical protein